MAFLALLLLPAAALAQQTLVVWHTESDPTTLAALADIGRRFTGSHPGVTVEFTAIGWNDIERRVLTAVESGVTPDIMQVEPHQAAYLVSRRHLQPLDDVLAAVGRDDFYPAVRDLQRYDGHVYGVPTALGISYVAVREDMVPAAGRTPVDTWDDALRLYESCRTARPDVAPLLLPANDLHLLILFSELLASNHGTLFDSQGRPAFANPRVVETLTFLARLYALVPEPLRNSNYPENFVHFAQGRACTLPGFFGRGTLSIMRQAPEGQRSPRTFGFVPHPRGPSAVRDGTPAYATLDAEPWVIPTRARSPQIAREFLRFFYRPEVYVTYAASVPLHLTPALQSVATSPAYEGLAQVQLWRPFHDELLQRLRTDTALPIFMSRIEDRRRPALFRLEGSHLVPEMIREVYRGVPPAEAAAHAQARAQQLVQGLPLDVDTDGPRASRTAARAGGRLGAMVLVGALVVALVAGFIWRARKRDDSPA